MIKYEKIVDDTGKTIGAIMAESGQSLTEIDVPGQTKVEISEEEYYQVIDDLQIL